jgi:hypothetical protein
MPATREYLQGLYDDALCYLCDINSQVELRQKNCTVCTIYLMSDQPLSPCRTKTNFTGLAPSCIIRARSNTVDFKRFGC